MGWTPSIAADTLVIRCSPRTAGGSGPSDQTERRRGRHRDAFQVLRACVAPLVVSVGMAVGLAVSAPFLVEGLLGQRYAGSVGLVRLLAMAALPSVLAQPAVAFLQARGKERGVAIATSAGIAVTLVTAGLAAGPLGAAAIPLGWLLGSSLLLSLLTRQIRQLVRRECAIET